MCVCRVALIERDIEYHYRGAELASDRRAIGSLLHDERCAGAC